MKHTYLLIYRNVCRLLCWNQNCDLPMRFETTTWWMKIVVKLRRIAAKIAHFNNENSEIVGRKFTKFGHDVAWLLPLNLLIADLRYQMPKQRVKVVPRDADCTNSYVLNSGSHQISTEMIADYYAEIKIAIFQSIWKRQHDEWRSSANCHQNCTF